jgi:hypothetical protein
VIGLKGFATPMLQQRVRSVFGSDKGEERSEAKKIAVNHAGAPRVKQR